MILLMLECLIHLKEGRKRNRVRHLSDNQKYWPINSSFLFYLSYQISLKLASSIALLLLAKNKLFQIQFQAF